MAEADTTMDLERELRRLEAELEETKRELDKTLKKLAKAERLYDRANGYNDDLRKEITQLSKELHTLRNSSKQTEDKAIQVAFEEENKTVSQFTNEKTDSYKQQEVMSSAQDALNSEKVEASEPMSIAESLKATAEEAMQQSGFVYDETTGLYYDYSTGYYYDAEKSLYYDPRTGTYYYYDEAKGKYRFHSQVQQDYYVTYANEAEPSTSEGHSRLDNRSKYDSRQSTSDVQNAKNDRNDSSHDRKRTNEKGTIKDKKKRERDKEKRKKHKKAKIEEKPKIRKKQIEEQIEEFDTDGEDEKHAAGALEKDDTISGYEHNQNNSNIHNSDNEQDIKNTDTGSNDVEDGEVDDVDSELEDGELSESGGEEEEEEEDECATQYPPCIRVIVKESDCLDIGSLYILTCTGATIGREKDMGHMIRIPDLQVSKMHASVQYDQEMKQYVIRDHASQNGTFVNSQRISESKTLGDKYPVSHGDIIQLGSTHLLCHIHPGLETCDECEPGQVQAKIQQEDVKEVEILSKEEKEQARRQQLKKIRKKFGLETAPYQDNTSAIKNKNYSDKAEIRRKTVGSDNPYQKDEAPASVDVAISHVNKGHKMLEKMGWETGQGLGKKQAGIKEPIKVNIRSKQTAGLGSGLSLEHSLDNVQEKDAQQKWLKAQERFNTITKKETDQSIVQPGPGMTTPKVNTWVKGDTYHPSEATTPDTGQTKDIGDNKEIIEGKKQEKIFEDI